MPPQYTPRESAPYTDPYWLREQFVVDGLSPAEIAADCGTDQATIQRWLTRHEIRP